VDTSNAVLLLADIGFLLAGLAYPLFRKYRDDQGDGGALVLLPKPHKISPLRGAWFVAAFLSLAIAHEALEQAYNIDEVYARFVTRVAALAVDHTSKAAADYLSMFKLGLRFLVVATILALSISVVASTGRRLIIAAHACWYLATMVIVDALIVVVVASTEPPTLPAFLAGQLIALWIGRFVMLRLLFANFALPRESSRPIAPRERASDGLVLGAVHVAALGGVASLYLLVLAHVGHGLRPLLAILLPLPFARLTSVVWTGLLHIVRWLGHASAGTERPGDLLEVIIPAYNEEAVIVETLQAIDAAARHYPGPVRVVMCDDGSTDATRRLAQTTIDEFRHAQGSIVIGNHGGKSAALNAALAECTADVVIRIDADTLVDEQCFVRAVPWFEDPTIGIVHALLIPRAGRSIFRKMRLFETLQQHGFLFRGLQMVDAVHIVPGVFSAFRREPIARIGGFTVGMNGEDGDMTLNMGRLGYRTWLDPTVIVYEDVPPSLAEFREQRIRWGRACIHAAARHFPLRAGIGAPRVWYSVSRMIIQRAQTPIRLAGVLYSLVLLGFSGEYATAAVVVVGMYLATNVFTSILVVLVGIRFGTTRRLGWMVFWPVFVLVKLWFALESVLSLPARPVLARRAELIAAPVVH
jgi:cellulose synthase/poly-beta-1,6-N-acetylglucosamine synthase-like glycosyltransferase